MKPMKSTLTMTRPHRIMAAALVFASMGLTGCGGEDEHAAAIRQAKMDLETLSATYGEGAKTSYEKVISSLAEAAESSNGGGASAARVIRSRAFVRQGEVAAAQAAIIEREAQTLATVVRHRHDQLLDLRAQSEALRKYDPSGDLKKIDEQIASKAQEIEQTKAALAQAEKDFEGIRQQTEAAQAKSREQRASEMTLRGQMTDKSQTERAELVRRANEVKREGDKFDLQAAELAAESARQAPNIAELKLMVERLEAQRVTLGEAKDQVAAAAAQATRQADRALNGVVGAGGVEFVGAKQLEAELTAAVEALQKSRGGLKDPNDEAARLYGQALSEAQRAKSATGGRGGSDTKLAEASVHHAEGDLLLTRGRGLESHSMLMKLLAETKPALPGATGYATEANEAAEEGKAQLAAAQDAFTKARDLYESAGASQKAQDVKDRLEQIARALASFSAPREAEPTDEGAAMTDGTPVEPTEGGVETPSATDGAMTGAQAEVFELLQKLSDMLKAKNYEGMTSLMVFRNSQQEEGFRKLVPLMAKQDALDEACRAQFGKGLQELAAEHVGSAGTGTMGSEALLQLRELDAANVDIRVTSGGEEAEVRMRSTPDAESLDAMKVDGAWKLKMDFDIPPMMATESFQQGLGKAMDTVTENVKSGKYGTDSKKLFDDLAAEMMKMLGQGTPPIDDNK